MRAHPPPTHRQRTAQPHEQHHCRVHSQHDNSCSQDCQHPHPHADQAAATGLNTHTSGTGHNNAAQRRAKGRGAPLGKMAASTTPSAATSCRCYRVATPASATHMSPRQPLAASKVQCQEELPKDADGSSAPPTRTRLRSPALAAARGARLPMPAASCHHQSSPGRQ